jgi:hypothetical protein
MATAVEEEVNAPTEETEPEVQDSLEVPEDVEETEDDNLGFGQEVEEAVEDAAPKDAEPKEKEDKPEPKTEEVTAEEPAISPIVRRRAIDQGWTEAQINKAGTTEAVEQLTTLFDSRLMAEAAAQQMPQPGAPQPQMPGQPMVAPQQPAAQPVPQPQADPNFKYEMKLADEVEESIATAMGGMNDHVSQHLTQNAQVIGGLMQQVQEMQVAMHGMKMSAFDAQIAALPEEYHTPDMLGKGMEHELDKNSTAYQNRVKLFNARETLPGLYQGRGLPAPASDVAFRAGLSQVFQDKVQELARRHVEKDVAARDKQRTAAPRKREAPRKRGGEDAVERIGREKAAKYGVSYDAESLEDDLGLS